MFSRWSHIQKIFKPVTLLKDIVLEFFPQFLCNVTFLCSFFFENRSIFSHQTLYSWIYYTLICYCHSSVFWGSFRVFFMRTVECFFMAFCIDIFVLLCQSKNEKKCNILPSPLDHFWIFLYPFRVFLYVMSNLKTSHDVLHRTFLYYFHGLLTKDALDFSLFGTCLGCFHSIF